MIAGERFRTPGVSGTEADKRFDRIEEVWKDNEVFSRTQLRVEPCWNHIAFWAANSIRSGELRVPPPPIDDVIAIYDEADYVLPPKISQFFWDYTHDDDTTHYPPTVEGIKSVEAIDI